MEIWAVLVFQALEIPYLSNLNQIVVHNIVDFLQQSNMVIHTASPLIVRKMGPGETPHYVNPHYARHYVTV